jgi:uncharacterized protein (TIGR02246 family)
MNALRRRAALLAPLGLAACASLTQADAEVAADLNAALDAQIAAWNKGDVEGFMAVYWRSDSLRFASGGDVQRGWAATLARYKARYPTPERMGRLSFSDREITVLAPDAALMFGRWALERAGDAPHGLSTLLFRKIAGRWVIAADHTSAA